jgi:hypothetical protein
MTSFHLTDLHSTSSPYTTKPLFTVGSASCIPLCVLTKVFSRANVPITSMQPPSAIASTQVCSAACSAAHSAGVAPARQLMLADAAIAAGQAVSAAGDLPCHREGRCAALCKALALGRALDLARLELVCTSSTSKVIECSCRCPGVGHLLAGLQLPRCHTQACSMRYVVHS